MQSRLLFVLRVGKQAQLHRRRSVQTAQAHAQQSDLQAPSRQPFGKNPRLANQVLYVIDHLLAREDGAIVSAKLTSVTNIG